MRTKIQRTDIGKFGTNGHHRISGATGANYPFPAAAGLPGPAVK